MRFGFIKHRNNKTKYISFNSRNCTACWKCVESCSQNVLGKIEIFKHRHACIDEPEKCTGCRKCLKACEYDAFSLIKEGI